MLHTFLTAVDRHIPVSSFNEAKNCPFGCLCSADVCIISSLLLVFRRNKPAWHFYALFFQILHHACSQRHISIYHRSL